MKSTDHIMMVVSIGCFRFVWEVTMAEAVIFLIIVGAFLLKEICKEYEYQETMRKIGDMSHYPKCHPDDVSKKENFRRYIKN
jgi:hypothetical protein